MRAFVVTGPHAAQVMDVEPPIAGPGQLVVDVARVGVCGTDVEFFTGEMAYLHSGHAHYPLRLGHEWCGTVTVAGEGVDTSWVGKRVTADTMLGCGTCERCRTGRQHVCEHRFEIGIRNGWPGALAEQLVVPVSAVLVLPDSLDDTAGALVEPGGNALRCVRAAGAAPGRRILVWGSGTIGLLAAQLAAAAGAEVHVVGQHAESFDLAMSFGVATTSIVDEAETIAVDAIIDATNDRDVPAAAVDRVEPGGTVVFIGLAGQPSLVDTRELVLKDVTAVGVLSASPGLRGVIEIYASGKADPRPIVGATVGLAATGPVLDQWRPADAGPGPKIHIDPRTG